MSACLQLFDRQYCQQQALFFPVNLHFLLHSYYWIRSSGFCNVETPLDNVRNLFNRILFNGCSLSQQCLYLINKIFLFYWLSDYIIMIYSWQDAYCFFYCVQSRYKEYLDGHAYSSKSII
jgi:hypothetical protein